MARGSGYICSCTSCSQFSHRDQDTGKERIGLRLSKKDWLQHNPGSSLPISTPSFSNMLTVLDTATPDPIPANTSSTINHQENTSEQIIAQAVTLALSCKLTFKHVARAGSLPVAYAINASSFAEDNPLCLLDTPDCRRFVVAEGMLRSLEQSEKYLAMSDTENRQAVLFRDAVEKIQTHVLGEWRRHHWVRQDGQIVKAYTSGVLDWNMFETNLTY
jgi:hypothetical protein